MNWSDDKHAATLLAACLLAFMAMAAASIITSEHYRAQCVSYCDGTVECVRACNE